MRFRDLVQISCEMKLADIPVGMCSGAGSDQRFSIVWVPQAGTVVPVRTL